MSDNSTKSSTNAEAGPIEALADPISSIKESLEEPVLTPSEEEARATKRRLRAVERAEKRARKVEQHPVRYWRGILGDGDRLMRIMAAVTLGVLSLTLSFTQLGFIGVGFNGNYSCYIMALMVPVALAALLFGRGGGSLMGLFAGGMQFLHSLLQPLDINESYFVSFNSSIVLYTLFGLIMGLLFAKALRGNPQGGRRIGYLAIACAVGCVIHHVLFIAAIILDLSIKILLSYVEMGLSSLVISTDVMRALYALGSTSMQFLFDFSLVLLTTLLGDFAVRKMISNKDNWGLRGTFRGWLAVVTSIVFMLVSALSFMLTTESAKVEAAADIKDEISYLIGMAKTRSEQLEALGTIIDEAGIGNEHSEKLLDAFSTEKVFDGYSEEADGTLVLFFNNQETNNLEVVTSDNSDFSAGSTATELFGEGGNEYLKRLAATGEMRQTIYHFSRFTDEGVPINDDTDAESSTELGFLSAGETDDGNYLITMMLPSSKVFASRAGVMTWMVILAFTLLGVVFWLISALIDIVVVRNIDRTNAVLAKITSGDLEQRVDVTTPREFDSLSGGINDTVLALRGWIGEAERRMENDLETARAIQSGALPQTFPPFPEIEAFDIFASMDAAKEVGGDFYDFFLIDEHTLGFLIADVSGKGIPGALFMMTAKTVIGNYMATGMELSEALASANAQLCANNEAGMFVTVWAATLDWETGVLTYVNAGHNFPLVRHGFNGDWEWIKKKCGLFLGAFETAKFKQESIVLKQGDELVLYTDGVNEAFSANDAEYGNDRLERFLMAHRDLHPRELVRSLRSDVASWANGAEQSDDVTILALEFGTAPEVTGSLTLPATLDHLEDVVAFINAELDQRLCPLGVRNKVEVALEELFVNVCRYAYADRGEPGEVTVSYSYSAEPSTISVELVDQGVPFDPLTLGDPTKPASIQEAKIGGLGIFMVKKSMDDLSYVYRAGSNVVSFTKRW